MQQSVLLQRLSHFQEPNPALRKHAEERAQSVQNRIADQITSFAGSQILELTKEIHSSTHVR